MRVRHLQRIFAVLRGWRKPSAPACLWIAFSLLCTPATSQPAPTVVVAKVQSERDDERLHILRDELRKAEALVEALAKRKAERLAVSDTAGVEETEAQRSRTLGDIAALQREIATMRPAADAAKPALSIGASTPTARALAKPRSATPWWDVYGKTRPVDASASNPSTSPPAPATARIDPIRRME